MKKKKKKRERGEFKIIENEQQEARAYKKNEIFISNISTVSCMAKDKVFLNMRHVWYIFNQFCLYAISNEQF